MGLVSSVPSLPSPELVVMGSLGCATTVHTMRPVGAMGGGIPLSCPQCWFLQQPPHSRMAIKREGVGGAGAVGACSEEGVGVGAEP